MSTTNKHSWSITIGKNHLLLLSYLEKYNHFVYTLGSLAGNDQPVTGIFTLSSEKDSPYTPVSLLNFFLEVIRTGSCGILYEHTIMEDETDTSKSYSSAKSSDNCDCNCDNCGTPGHYKTRCTNCHRMNDPTC